jgi:hypothetical protein
MIWWDVIFNVERVKQPFLPTRQLSHHAANPPAGQWTDFAPGQAGDLLFQQNRPLAVRRDRLLLADTSTVVTMFFGVGDQVEVGLL